MIQGYLFISGSKGRGRGVYTRDRIPAGTIIEVSPVLVMSFEERKLLDQTLLHDYIFEWGDQKDKCCVGLGYISLYNHSVPSNSEYFMDYDEEIMFVKTVRAIDAGEEVTINYNGDYKNEDPVWFEVIP
jgi:SET domain-containing protein